MYVLTGLHFPQLETLATPDAESPHRTAMDEGQSKIGRKSQLVGKSSDNPPAPKTKHSSRISLNLAASASANQDHPDVVTTSLGVRARNFPGMFQTGSRRSRDV